MYKERISRDDLRHAVNRLNFYTKVDRGDEWVLQRQVQGGYRVCRSNGVRFVKPCVQLFQDRKGERLSKRHLIWMIEAYVDGYLACSNKLN